MHTYIIPYKPTPITLSVCVCVCVCVSVTLRYCIKTAKRTITQITPHDSPCFVVTEFLLTSASRGPSAIAKPLVERVESLDYGNHEQLSRSQLK